MLVANIEDWLSMAEVGQSSGNQCTFRCKERCGATVCFEEHLMSVCFILFKTYLYRVAQSHNQLRYNTASKSDTSAYILPPTDGTFQQYRCVSYHVSYGYIVLKQHQAFVLLMEMGGRQGTTN